MSSQFGLAGSIPSTGGGGSGIYTYAISNSVRCDTNNGYLHRTPSSAGNRSTWTFSTWIKLAQMGTGTRIIYSAGSSGNQDGFYRLFYNANKLVVGSANANFVTPSDTFRDPSAWYHIVWKQGSNATTLYVNGEQIATASVSGNTAVNNNTIQCIGTSSYGGSPTNTEHLDGYFAETIMIDGTALDADSFGETKNGVWIPKDASGLTYGTNGFRLTYGNASDLGEDSAGSNDWTAVNLATHDQTGDTPAFNSSSNGGNFATLGILWKTPDMTFSEGNLRANTTTNNRGVMSNWEVPDGDKWYWEIYPTIASGEQWLVGINYATVDFTSDRGGRATGVSYDSFDGKKRVDNNTASSYGSSWATGDIIGIAVDRVNDTIQFYKNGSGQGTIDISGLNNTEFFPWCGCGGGSGDNIIVYNFGAEGTFAGSTTAGGNSDDTGYGNFKYSVPSGFKALCAGNLPLVAEIDPAQTDDNYPQKLFNAILYTGDGGSSTSITGVGFQPDWVWIKRRNASENHNLYDSTRGVNKRIQSNRDVPETTEGLPSFDSDGFTVDASGGINNVSSQTYVAWNWRANGGTETTNNTGTQTSYTQIDPSGGFSIVRYAGTGSSMTVGHGLSVEPKLTIIKDRDATIDWIVYTKVIDGSLDYFFLNTTSAVGDSGLTGANSSIWNFNSASSYSNTSGRNYIMYNFANVEGYCKVSTYKGNSDNNGSAVYCGFRPAWILLREVASVDNWGIYDDKRIGQNNDSGSGNAVLYPDTNNGEENQASRAIDLTAFGFKLRTSNSTFNNNATYLYLAMAHNPFQYSTSR